MDKNIKEKNKMELAVIIYNYTKNYNINFSTADCMLLAKEICKSEVSFNAGYDIGYQEGKESIQKDIKNILNI